MGDCEPSAKRAKKATEEEEVNELYEKKNILFYQFPGHESLDKKCKESLPAVEDLVGIYDLIYHCVKFDTEGITPESEQRSSDGTLTLNLIKAGEDKVILEGRLERDPKCWYRTNGSRIFVSNFSLRSHEELSTALACKDRRRIDLIAVDEDISNHSLVEELIENRHDEVEGYDFNQYPTRWWELKDVDDNGDELLFHGSIKMLETPVVLKWIPDDRESDSDDESVCDEPSDTKSWTPPFPKLSLEANDLVLTLNICVSGGGGCSDTSADIVFIARKQAK